MANEYLDSILRGQAQSKVTGRGALTSPQIEAAFKGELAARYESDVSRQKEAFQESATNRSLDMQQKGLDAQISAGNKQSIVSGVGAVGQAAIGGALAKKAFFDTGTKSATQEGVTGGGSATGTATVDQAATTQAAGAGGESAAAGGMDSAVATYGVSSEAAATYGAAGTAGESAAVGGGKAGAAEVGGESAAMFL
jgi:hypothetical protein